MQSYKALLLLGSIIIWCSTNVNAQWNPHAGVIESYTLNASTMVSSNPATQANLIDGDESTHWQSTAPLPVNYITREDQNDFLNEGNNLFTSTADPTDYSAATDGDLGGNIVMIPAIGGIASLELNFPTPQEMLLISLKANAADTIHLYSYSSPTDSTYLGLYDPVVENFSFKRFDINSTDLTTIRLYSDNDFHLVELSGLSEHPKEYGIVDLGNSQLVGEVITRHWAGSSTATASYLYLSQDAVNWTQVAVLDSEALGVIHTSIEPAIMARYIKVEHSVAPIDFNSVFIWELSAYDEDGKFGAAPAPQVSAITLGEMLGVNGIWGWGHDVYSHLLADGEGAELYNSVSQHARNYHAMDWDVLDPDNTPDYVTMAAGGGTETFAWLNWDQEYQEWVNAGLDIQASIIFSHVFEDDDWDTPFQSAYDYGYAFATHFGPTNGNGFIKEMEVGNEPWFYDSLVYQNILHGMASGAKAADPAMQVFPCALQACDPSVEDESGFKHYMGTRLLETAAPYLDGVNIHAYSFTNDTDGTRIATYPEQSQSEYRTVNNAIRFRNENMPNKKLYLSEWGWDMAGPTEDCTHSECVSEDAGAVYTVRAAMMWLRLGLDRATYFFYANANAPSSLFTRSGLTESGNNDFAKKKAFYALETLVDSLGNRHFIDAIETDSAWIYLFGNEYGTATHLVAWRPIDGDDTSTIDVDMVWEGAYQATSATIIDGNNIGGTPTTVPEELIKGQLTLTLGTAPVLIGLKPDYCIDNLYLTAGMIESTTYQVQETITSDAITPDNSDVYFKAGTCIELKAGFEVELGNEFEATIEGCTPE